MLQKLLKENEPIFVEFLIVLEGIQLVRQRKSQNDEGKQVLQTMIQ